MEGVLKKSGKAILLGNEAIVRGALEAGVQFVAAYPGTPSSEVGIVFSQIAKDAGVYFEYSTNEKVALEAVIGASFSGLKSLCAMKNFGLNVASDSLLPFCYTGSKGATVLLVADDPSCHSSAQSEENSRAFAQLAHIPILEPSDPQECKDFTKLAFQISEKFEIPVMIRSTTRVAHQKMPVVLGKINGLGSKPVSFAPGQFIENKNKFVTMPPRVLEMHKELLEKIAKIKVFSEKSPLNQVSGARTSAGLGIVSSGVSYLYVKEALKELKLDLPVLKLGFFYPLAENKIKQFIKNLKQVLVVEELEPYLEKEVQALAKDVNPKLHPVKSRKVGIPPKAELFNRVKIFGKSHLSEVGELRPDDVIKAVAEVAGKKLLPQPKESPKKIKHLPRFCTVPTCPYWKMFAAVKKAVGQAGIGAGNKVKKVVFGGDIGCYMIAALKPHNLYDYISCMGSSAGIAHGIAKATEGKQKVIAFMGDSTFFHAGIPALINAVYNNSNILLIIGDNRITAMTGHQPNPGSGTTGMGQQSSEIKIEDIAKAVQVKNVKVLDPVDQFDLLVSTIKEFIPKQEPSVIVSRKVCALLAKRQAKKKQKQK